MCELDNLIIEENTSDKVDEWEDDGSHWQDSALCNSRFIVSSYLVFHSFWLQFSIIMGQFFSSKYILDFYNWNKYLPMNLMALIVATAFTPSSIGVSSPKSSWWVLDNNWITTYNSIMDCLYFIFYIYNIQTSHHQLDIA